MPPSQLSFVFVANPAWLYPNFATNSIFRNDNIPSPIKSVFGGIIYLVKDNLSKTLIVVALILGIALLGYGYLNYDYKMKALKNDKELKAEELKVTSDKEAKRLENYVNCLNKVDTQATEFWNQQCQKYGIDKSGKPFLKDNCSLPNSQADTVHTFKKEQRTVCDNLFGK